eukprot:COSAG02_NODE_48358_length_334_cov_0.868085_1_plen_64_part_01
MPAGGLTRLIKELAVARGEQRAQRTRARRARTPRITDYSMNRMKLYVPVLLSLLQYQVVHVPVL